MQLARTRAHARRQDAVFGKWTASAVIAVAFAGSGLLTPLYALYQRAFGFSEITLTLVYAAYVIGNVASLLFFGRLSDRIGRRTIAMASVATGCISMVLFLLASGTAWLFAARVLSGIAVGLASGTGTAWLADLDGDKRRASVTASIANAFGFSAGPLIGGVLAQYNVSPLQTPFYAYVPLLFLTGAATFRACETVRNARPHVDAALLRPKLGVPKEIIAQFFAPAITAFCTYALVGYYAALIPTVLRQGLHTSSAFVAGAIVFELAFLAGLWTMITRDVASRIAMNAALLLLLPSVALLLLAQTMHSLTLLLLASAFGSACWGLGARGSLQVVNEISPADRRGQVAAVYYIVGFAGNSIPVIGIGFIAVAAGEMTASLIFGCTIAAFAAAALAIASVFTNRNATTVQHRVK